MTWGLSLLLGMGLSAACGLRVFLPPLILSMGALYFQLPLPSALDWLASETAFLILLTATVLEIGAYYVPWLDNVLDGLATPAAMVAGTLLTGSLLGELNPAVQWSLALVAGGGTAASVQTLTQALRLTSSVVTGGLANPVVASTENAVAVAWTVALILFPVITVGLGLVALLLGWRWWRRRRQNVSPPDSQ